MKSDSSRRSFLAASVALPAAGLAKTSNLSEASATLAAPASAPVALAKPKYKTLGRTGLKVTTVSFGCMITSDPSVIERAADVGIIHFDTARGYQGGNNERMVGAALKSRRKNLVVSSKSHSMTKAEALKNLDTSLQTIGTDYLDIWYLHAKSKAEHITDEWLEAQEIARKAGKIRFAGVSTHNGQDEVINAAIKCGKVDVVLVGYNFATDAKVGDAIAAAHKAGLGVVGMKVMAGGFRRMKPDDKAYGILKRDGAMPAALRWVLKNPNIDTTIPSMTDMEQLDENFKAMSEKFTASDEKVLAQQLDFIRPLYCRQCGACEGKCPQGLPVADMLRYLMYADGYGQYPLARERFLELPSEMASVRCRDCSGCTIECPNGVRVSERLTRAQELLA
jgi:predicted aldo/keto reductase-like oxidoreductase